MRGKKEEIPELRHSLACSRARLTYSKWRACSQVIIKATGVLFYFLFHQLLPQDGPFVLYFWPPVIHIYGAKNVSIMKTLR